MSPLFQNKLLASLSARRSNHPQSGSSCQLDSRDPNSTTGSMHQDGLTRFSLSSLEQGSIGSSIRHVNPSPFDQRNPIGQVIDLRFQTEG